MHNLEEVVDVTLRDKFKVYFSADASCGYWAVPIKPGEDFSAAVTTPHGQHARWMGMGLRTAMSTYPQFTDLVLGPLPGDDERSIPREEVVSDH